MRHRNGNRGSGFTLIELMVVVIVLGILAAAIIPQFSGTTYDAKVSRAEADIATLGSALERFNLTVDRYPTTEEGLKALLIPPAGAGERWRGPYIKELRLDPWDNPYQYRSPGLHGIVKSYDLWSNGADGVEGGEGPGADITSWVEE